MNGEQYLILGYVIGLGLLWGYALTLWLATRATDRKGRLAPRTLGGGESL